MKTFWIILITAVAAIGATWIVCSKEAPKSWCPKKIVSDKPHVTVDAHNEQAPQVTKYDYSRITFRDIRGTVNIYGAPVVQTTNTQVVSSAITIANPIPANQPVLETSVAETNTEAAVPTLEPAPPVTQPKTTEEVDGSWQNAEYCNEVIGSGLNPRHSAHGSWWINDRVKGMQVAVGWQVSFYKNTQYFDFLAKEPGGRWINFDQATMDSRRFNEFLIRLKNRRNYPKELFFKVRPL